MNEHIMLGLWVLAAIVAVFALTVLGILLLPVVYDAAIRAVNTWVTRGVFIARVLDSSDGHTMFRVHYKDRTTGVTYCSGWSSHPVHCVVGWVSVDAERPPTRLRRHLDRHVTELIQEAIAGDVAAGDRDELWGTDESCG